MTTKGQRVKSAIFVLIGGGLLLIVLIVFGGIRLWRGSHRYTIYFDDTVYGLENGGAVYFEGVRVGSVDALDITRSGGAGRVRAVIDIDADTPIKADTKAYLLYAGITGVKEIDLRDGSPALPVLEPGNTIPVGQTAFDKLQDRLTAMTDRAAELLDNVNRIAENLVKLTDPAEVGDIITQTKRASVNLAAASESLNAMIGENRAALRTTLASVEAAAGSASELLRGRIASFAARADDLVAQLDRMVRANGGQLNSAMSDLAQASRSFKDLVRDLRQSPSRLLFSKPPPERKLP